MERNMIFLVLWDKSELYEKGDGMKRPAEPGEKGIRR